MGVLAGGCGKSRKRELNKGIDEKSNFLARISANRGRRVKGLLEGFFRKFFENLRINIRKI